MAATTVSNLITAVRQHLVEASAIFWTDQEIVDHLNRGAKDLWKALQDLHQNHFFTLDATNVSFAASSTTLSGVPSDVQRVLLIEPRDLVAYPHTIFTPKPYQHPDFSAARASAAVDPVLRTFFYAITGEGNPLAAPTIYVAPQASAAINLTVGYVPVLKTMVASGPGAGQSANNVIPGESDMALIAWAVAFSRAKEREDRKPDPDWIAIYGTEKQNLMTVLTPRQTQEPEVVEALFEGWWGSS